MLFLTVGRLDRVEGLRAAARAPRQPIALEDKVDYCLVHLEQLSSERTEQQRPPLSPVDWEACLMFPSVTAT
eukprot:g6985.t1